MVTLLQLSDIHFRKKSEETDEYTQIRTRMIERVEDYCLENTIDGIMICGDVAFSGKKAEYEKKAIPFINQLRDITMCSDGKIFLIPGNHDKVRDMEGKFTRVILRNGILHDTKGDDTLDQIRHKEQDTLKKLYEPFGDYIKFAASYRCASEVAVKSITDKPLDDIDKMYWKAEIDILKSYHLNLFGINTCLVSDDADYIHKQALPKLLYNISKHRNEINISMMHHPTNFIENGEKIESVLNQKFALQFYGHIHQQTVKAKDTIKIFSGALHPDWSDETDKKKYVPIFNFIELDVEEDKLQVRVKSNVWKWIQNDDGYFIEEEVEVYEVDIRDSATKNVKSENVTVELPNGISQRDIEIQLIRHPYCHNIISKMYPEFPITDDNMNDCMGFLERVKRDNKYIELYNKLDKYGR